MPSLTLAGITKRFGATRALDAVDLAVDDGELLAVLGPSGSGKSTLLRVVAGLEAPSEGRIRLGARDVTALPPRARNIAMVFQDAALYPHMTVRANLAFGAEARRTPEDEVARRVRAAAAALELEPFLARYPRELSGGERQRVALGGAIVRRPDLLLLDEPFAHLDTDLKLRVREELVALRAALRVTTLLVTHDHAEAMALGRRIAVLDRGRIRQVDSPGAVYRTPADALVARAVGNPPMNLLPVAIRPCGDRLECRAGPHRFTLPAAPFAIAAPREALLGLRPEALVPVPSVDAALCARIVRIERLGKETILMLDAALPRELRALAAPDFAGSEGDEIALGFNEDDVLMFEGEEGKSLRSA